MKFGNLDIGHFLTIDSGKVNLSDRGLLLIQGANEDDSSADSNGAGKSSVADAVCWCLYGTTARGVEGDRVINRYSKKDCFVTLEIIDGEDQWLVERYRKHTTFKNQLTVFKFDPVGKVWTGLTKGTEKLTQELVNQILGCTYDVFRGAIYAGQNDMLNLPGMTDKQLKLLVEEAAGTAVLERAYEEARARALVIGREQQAIVEKVAACDQVLLSSGDTLKSMSDRQGEFETERTASVARLKIIAKEAADDARAKAAEIFTLNKPDVEAGIAECDASIASVNAERAEERALANIKSKADNEVAALTRQLTSLRSQHDIAKKVVGEVDHKVGCPCDDCGRPLTASEIAPARKSASDRVAKLAQEFNATKATARDAVVAQTSATDALEAFRASMTDVSTTSAQRASLLAQLTVIHTAEKARDKLIDAARAYLTQANDKAKEVNPFVAEIERVQASMAVKQQNRRDLCLLNETALQKKAIIEACVKVYAPNGVRGHILDEVTPYLNDQTAKYLGTLSDGNITATWTTLSTNAKGEMKEKFNIDVTNAEGGESFQAISGGEQRKVQVASALALQDLVATRAAKPIDLFIGDEIDNALDKAGVERMTQILEEKGRERGTVLIISHQELKDFVRQVITVRKKDKKSTIEEVAA
jgi:DNA repair exonuclease SbcCD ATPase subunit